MREKGFGIKLEADKKSCASNLRFADDVLLMANSLETAQKDDDRHQKKYRGV